MARFTPFLDFGTAYQETRILVSPEKVKTFIEEEIDITFTNNEGFHNELNKNAILSMHLSNEYSSEESPPFTKIRNWEEISKVIAILSTTSKNDEKYRKMIKNNIKST